ncbi:MAG: DNA-formamidopyrimidine glycosylase family protein, partial [Halioglobus sp.]
MPELPEVETTRRGVAPWCLGEVVEALVVREPRLRWPVPPRLGQQLVGQRIEAIDRRGKYLLFRTATGSLLVHLGMSGSLRVVDAGQLPGRHDHIDIRLQSGACLRYHDPRRFGCFLWLEPGELHPLLSQ